MAKVDSLKEEINTKRVFLDKFIIIAIAILTGIVTSIYQVLSGKVPIYVLLVVGIGFIGLAVIINIIVKTYEHINERIKELENV